MVWWGTVFTSEKRRWRPTISPPQRGCDSKEHLTGCTSTQIRSLAAVRTTELITWSLTRGRVSWKTHESVCIPPVSPGSAAAHHKQILNNNPSTHGQSSDTQTVLLYFKKDDLFFLNTMRSHTPWSELEDSHHTLQELVCIVLISGHIFYSVVSQVVFNSSFSGSYLVTIKILK